MEQRINVLTIGADDLPAMRNFYEHVLGWTAVAGNKDIAFINSMGFY
jgi:catechol 2,3-dioxygenase-like lactoylglutathione lyase family enzyme